MKITEQQLNAIIKENIQQMIDNGEIDESVIGGIKGAAKGIGNALKGEFGKLKRGATETGLNNEYNGETFKNRVKAFGNQVKSGYNNGDKIEELNKAINAINAIKDKSILGPKGVQYADALIKCINMSIKGGNGRYKQNFNNRYGYNAQTVDNNTNNVRRIAEARIQEIVKESIEKNIK